MRLIPISVAAVLAAGGCQSPPAGKEPDRVVQAFYDAFNRRDIEGVMAVLAPKVASIAASDTIVQDSSEKRRYYEMLFTVLPAMRLEVRKRRVDGGTVVDELLTRGGPCGEVQTGIITYEVVDSRIRSVTEPPITEEMEVFSIVPGVHVSCPVSSAR
jgi:hypothetical protein